MTPAVGPGAVRRGLRGLLALLVLLAATTAAFPLLASAQEGPRFEVRATLDPPAATLGDRVRLRIAVRHDQDLVVTAENPRQVGPQLEFVATEPEELQFDPVGGGATTTFTFVLAAFRLGEVQPGTVTVSWLRDDGSTGSQEVQPPPLQITPVRRADDDQLRPL
jgi:hypothetical protein